MAEPTKPVIISRPLFGADLMTPEERAEKFRAFARMVIENYEAAGATIPADDPLRLIAEGRAAA